MNLWLARHATTDANREGRFQGRLDFPLSAEGRCEANLLARRLASLAVDAILSSDLSRARETARIIASENGAPLAVTSLLRESSWGAIEGMTRAEIARCFPYLEASWRAGRTPFIPGAESRRRLKGRCRLFLGRLEGSYSLPATILLVSHGRLINALLATVLGRPARCRWPFVPAPASLSLLKQSQPGGKWHLVVFDDCRHLEKTLSRGPLAVK